MQKVIAKIQETFETCIALQKDLETKRALAIETANQQKVKTEELTMKEQSLNAREKAVKKIEDAVKYHEEADALMAQAKASLESVQKRVQSFSTYETSAREEIRHKNEALDKRAGEITDREANLENLILEKVKSVLKK